MASWISALKRSRESFGESLGRVFRRPDEHHEEVLEELEDALLGADLSPTLAMDLIEEIDSSRKATPAEKLQKVKVRLLEALPKAVEIPAKPKDGPLAVMLVGVNGSGKTTTAAKLAYRMKQQGRTPLLAAGDTFRAAGTGQLALWAKRLGIDIVSAQTGSDPASVAYDSLQAGQARNVDIVILDTAGRMHTKKPLMVELDKIRRSMGKSQSGAPHEVWIVLDASIGQNAVLQAEFFHEAVPLTGVIVTKLDGSSRAGFLFSVVEKLGVPVYFAGLGEGESDLTPFDPESFVDALLSTAAGSED